MRSAPILLAMMLAALLPGVGCEKRKAGKPRLGEVERLPRVETVVLGKPAKLEVVRSYTATVESLEKADLCAMVKGYVKELPIDLDIGKTAKTGDLLFSLYVPDLIAERDNKKALVEQGEKAGAEQARAPNLRRRRGFHRWPDRVPPGPDCSRDRPHAASRSARYRWPAPTRWSR